MLRTQLVIIILQYFRGTLDVAAYRAVQPVADLNTVVMQSFALLFMPTMARMFARNDQGVDDLYWQNAIWITVISFPIFLVTFSLAQPLTLLLFGARYAQSGLILALLAFGYYFNAALGYNADTLRIYGRLRYTIAIDFVSMFVNLALSLLLIPRFGALGAALATSATLVIYNVLNHVGLKFATPINLFQWRSLRIYASAGLGTVLLAMLQTWFSFPIYIGVILAGFISLIVLLFNWDILKIEQTFPELLRVQIIRSFFESRRGKKQLID